MYRSKQPITHVNFLYDSGGLGDCIARLPAIKYVFDNHKHVVMHVWVPDFFLEFAKHSLPKGINIKPFSKRHEYNDKLNGRAFDVWGHTTLGTHLVDHAFNVAVNQQVDISHKNYLPVDISKVKIDKFNLPKKYVVMTTAYTSEVRQFLPEHINKIVLYIKSKGYDVVFLGKEEVDNGYIHTIKGNLNDDIDYSQGTNLINSSTLLETAKIIQNSVCVVGLDNGLLHVAGTTEVPIVAGYTTVLSQTRMPYRHNQLGWNCYPVELTQQELACRGCQTNWQFTYNHDFTKCYYVEKKQDTEIKCLKLLNADKYIEQLERIL